MATEPERSVLIAVPHLEPLQGWFVDRLMSMTKPEGSGLARVQYKPLDAARTSLAQYAVDMGFTHVLFLDSDMVVPYDVIPRLMNQNTPIASALYYSRNEPTVPHAYRYKTTDAEGMRWYQPIGRELSDYLKGQPGLLDPKNTNITSLRADHLVGVDAIGFGCVLIETEALIKIPKPWFLIDDGGGGEDFHFCEQAAQVGIQPVVNLALQCDHEIRPIFIGRNDWVEQWGINTDEEFDWSHEGQILFSVGPAGVRRARPVMPEEEMVAQGGGRVAFTTTEEPHADPTDAAPEADARPDGRKPAGPVRRLFRLRP